MASYIPKQVETWREQHNPLRGLTIQRVASLLESAEKGYLADAQWLFRWIQKRDATVLGAVRRRQSALMKLDWDIRIISDVEEGGPKADKAGVAKEQAKVLREFYEGIENMREAICFLGMATFNGYSHLEKHYRNNRKEEGVFRLQPVPQWFWAKHMPKREWLYNPKADQTNHGKPIEPMDWVVRNVDQPIMEVATICFLRKNLSQKDWDGFIETYGLPPLFIELPPGATSNDETNYQEIAEKVIGDSRGTLPAGASVQTVETGDRGEGPFSTHIKYQDEQIVLAATGGKLTMLNDATGIGSGQSDAHSNTFEEIAKAEALEIAEVFQHQIDRVILEERFPTEDQYAYFEIAAKDDLDVADYLANAAKLQSLGFQVDLGEVQEKTGMKLTIKEEPKEDVEPGKRTVKTAPAGVKAKVNPLRNRFARKPESKIDSDFTDKMSSRFNRAVSADLASVRQRLETILAIDNPTERANELRRLRDQLPELLAKMNADPVAAKILEDAMSSGYFNGMEAAVTA